MQLFWISSWFVLITTWPAWALTPAAEAYLERLPEKALTLDLVADRAVDTSDSFRGVASESLSLEAPEWSALSAFDAVVFASVGWMDDRQQPEIPFQPNRKTGKEYRLGVSKYFSSGTQLSMEFLHGNTEISFATPGIIVNPYAQSRGQLTLSQSLWKDFFGAGSRAGLEASALQTKANQAALQAKKEQWFLSLAREFYSAWMAQENGRAAKQSLIRQDRLLRTVQLKLKRGTSEPPDLLQVESMRAGAEARLGVAKQALGDSWRNLVMTLKLPADFMDIDPDLVPMKLDNPVPAAIEKCGPPQSPAPPPTAYSNLELARYRRQAAELIESRARSEYNPDLKLALTASANRVSSNPAESTLDFIDGRFPRWEAGLRLTIPLGFHQQKANLARASADAIAAGAMASMEEDLLKADWLNSCLHLHRMVLERELYFQAATKQTRRERLEQERFELGRSNTLQVTSAGNEATDALLRLTSAEVELRLAAWKISRFTGDMNRYLLELEK
jgi:outer membrane protein TolC